jgi:hypothetical protein
VIPARSLAEAQLWADTDTCECGGLGVAWELSALWHDGDTMQAELSTTCGGCYRARQLSFTLPPAVPEGPPGHFAPVDAPPSGLYDAVEWWAFAHLYADQAAEDPSDAAANLIRAAAATDEALRFLPPGAAALPAEAVRTPWSQEALRATPESFTREALQEQRAALWLRAETAGPDVAPDTPPPPGQPMLSARSAVEENMYMSLHSCACGQVDPPSHMGLGDTDDGDPYTRFHGECPSCGAQREFLFAQLPDDLEPEEYTWAVGAEPSRLIDPGEWDLVVETLLSDDEPSDDLAADLRCAASAVDEILKFIPAGADEVPQSAFWTPRGLARWVRAPYRFRRAFLEGGRRYCLTRAMAVEQGIS